MNFLENENLIKAKEKRFHYFFSFADLPLPTWDDVIRCLDYNVEHDIHLKHLENFGLVLHNTNSIKMIGDMLDNYSKLDLSLPSSSHLYISFCSKSKTFGWHKDNSDVLIWQIIGSTMFSVDQNGIHTYCLKPNDFLYIPKGIMHNTNPLTPRVVVSFGLDYS